MNSSPERRPQTAPPSRTGARGRCPTRPSRERPPPFGSRSTARRSAAAAGPAAATRPGAAPRAAAPTWRWGTWAPLPPRPGPRRAPRRTDSAGRSATSARGSSGTAAARACSCAPRGTRGPASAAPGSGGRRGPFCCDFLSCWYMEMCYIDYDHVIIISECDGNYIAVITWECVINYY